MYTYDQTDFMGSQSKGQYDPSANLFGQQDPSGVSELSQSQSKQSIQLNHSRFAGAELSDRRALRADEDARVP